MGNEKSRKLRHGFTTGSCAAAASAAGAWMLLFGRELHEITIQTPKGIPYQAGILEIERSADRVKCAVRKDGGDDPDITTGTLIFSEVTIADPVRTQPDGSHVLVDGGEGIGRVTLPGLDQPVGNAAINHVPREMIAEEVGKICGLADFPGTLSCIISCPAGKELSRKTFNPRLGIEGGISVLGTSGVVEPMSEKALIDTIHTELRQRRALGDSKIVIAPGNYGQDFLLREYGFDIDRSVKCSNYVGDTIDLAAEEGFESMLLIGHIGKLIKLSGGITNTHSKEGDCRMELLTASALRCGADGDTGRAILPCAVTEEALRILKKAGLLEAAMDDVLKRAMATLERRADDRIRILCMIYSNEFGLLAGSPGAEEYLKSLC